MYIFIILGEGRGEATASGYNLPREESWCPASQEPLAHTDGIDFDFPCFVCSWLHVLTMGLMFNLFDPFGAHGEDLVERHRNEQKVRYR